MLKTPVIKEISNEWKNYDRKAVPERWAGTPALFRKSGPKSHGFRKSLPKAFRNGKATGGHFRSGPAAKLHLRAARARTRSALTPTRGGGAGGDAPKQKKPPEMLPCGRAFPETVAFPVSKGEARSHFRRRAFPVARKPKASRRVPRRAESKQQAKTRRRAERPELCVRVPPPLFRFASEERAIASKSQAPKGKRSLFSEGKAGAEQACRAFPCKQLNLRLISTKNS